VRRGDFDLHLNGLGQIRRSEKEFPMNFRTVVIERRGRVAVVRLHRPEALNALNAQLLDDVMAAFDQLEPDPDIGAFVLTGGEKAFAVGADIKEMAEMSYSDVLGTDYLAGWGRRLADLRRKPMVAAVAGYALGGGCELALMADFIIAAENAKFGQPEVKLGVIPGMGATQRLTRAIGKAKAMDMCLTGRLMDAQEAEKAGLVARIAPTDKLIDVAVEAAEQIAAYPAIAVAACKEAVDRALETTLAEGALFERRAFHALFATEDKKEGMAAFVEKRPPRFRGKS
jgi:enoyl-CoA hydratase